MLPLIRECCSLDQSFSTGGAWSPCKWYAANASTGKKINESKIDYLVIYHQFVARMCVEKLILIPPSH